MIGPPWIAFGASAAISLRKFSSEAEISPPFGLFVSTFMASPPLLRFWAHRSLAAQEPPAPPPSCLAHRRPSDFPAAPSKQSSVYPVSGDRHPAAWRNPPP